MQGQYSDIFLTKTIKNRLDSR